MFCVLLFSFPLEGKNRKSENQLLYSFPPFQKHCSICWRFLRLFRLSSVFSGVRLNQCNGFKVVALLISLRWQQYVFQYVVLLNVARASDDSLFVSGHMIIWPIFMKHNRDNLQFCLVLSRKQDELSSLHNIAMKRIQAELVFLVVSILYFCKGM